MTEPEDNVDEPEHIMYTFGGLRRLRERDPEAYERWLVREQARRESW